MDEQPLMPADHQSRDENDDGSVERTDSLDQQRTQEHGPHVDLRAEYRSTIAYLDDILDDLVGSDRSHFQLETLKSTVQQLENIAAFLISWSLDLDLQESDSPLFLESDLLPIIVAAFADIRLASDDLVVKLRNGGNLEPSDRMIQAMQTLRSSTNTLRMEMAAANQGPLQPLNAFIENLAQQHRQPESGFVIRILFALSLSPEGFPLNVVEQTGEIQEILDNTNCQQVFQLCLTMNSTAEITKSFAQCHPSVIHLPRYGGELRILLGQLDDRPAFDHMAFCAMLKKQRNLDLAVLGVCDSQSYVQDIANVVGHAVAFRTKTPKSVIRDFLQEFYRHIGNQLNYKEAFHRARRSIESIAFIYMREREEASEINLQSDDVNVVGPSKVDARQPQKSSQSQTSVQSATEFTPLTTEGPEWNPVPLELFGHLLQVNALAMSPNNNLMASASHDGTIKLWDMVTGQKKQTLTGHITGVSAVAFASNGNLLASASSDRTIVIWDIAAMQKITSLRGHNKSVMAVAFSHDNTLLASGSDDGEIRLWDADTFRLIHVLSGHTGRVTALGFTTNSKVLASASQDGTIRLWDTQTARETRKLREHTDFINAMVFSPDSTLLASASNDKTIKIWKMATANVVFTLAGHTSAVNAVVFSPNGRLLASASNDKTVKIWDFSTGSCWKTFTNHLDPVHTVSFSVDGSLLASASSNGQIITWDVQVAYEMWNLSNDCGSGWLPGPDNSERLSFSLDGQFLVSEYISTKPSGEPAYHDITLYELRRSVQAWRWRSSAEKTKLPGRFLYLNEAVAFSARNELLASQTVDSWVRVWDTRTGDELHQLSHYPYVASAMALSSANMLLASVSETMYADLEVVRSIIVHDIMTGQQKWIVSEPRNLIMMEDYRATRRKSLTALAFTPSGSVLAHALNVALITLRLSTTGQVLRTFGSTFGIPRALSMHHHLLATVSAKRYIEIFNINTKMKVQSFDTGQLIRAIRFSADSQYLLTDRGSIPIPQPSLPSDMIKTLRTDASSYNTNRCISLASRHQQWLNSIGCWGYSAIYGNIIATRNDTGIVLIQLYTTRESTPANISELGK